MNKEGKLFVVSFYEGLQRVALFTTDRCVYKLICDSEKMEVPQQEISILLQNIGVSLVNNTYSQEVAFIGITRYNWTEKCFRTYYKALLWCGFGNVYFIYYMC